MALTVYQYPKCSTCRKALKWLPPAHSTLANALKHTGLPLRALFNTSGESYRNGGFKERLPSLSQAEALGALAQDGKLIKRPLLIDGERVLVGFDEKRWSETLL
jgi:arsenate reductase